ncbi:hypothetical protein SNE40_020685 [Patella caerulea]|uniref:Uncharacterized protein n=1 Tax=Patella caerulea TaxID=87958 RepID=A0AAN8J5D7_PATCE
MAEYILRQALIILFVTNTLAGLDIQYMYDFCGQDLNVGNGIRLVSRNQSTDCTVTIKTNINDTNTKLRIAYERPLSLNCTDASLHLYLNGTLSGSGIQLCNNQSFDSTYDTTGDTVVIRINLTKDTPAGGVISLRITKIRYSSTCDSGEFKCHNNRCIDTSLMCDSYDDCGDYSDEHCFVWPQRPCNKSEFVCDNHYCIDKVLKCNSHDDCYDNSDEDTVKCCQDTMFKCDNGKCIDPDMKCDGDDDCGDDSDESSCTTVTCGSLEFKCTNSKCVPRSDQCNGMNPVKQDVPLFIIIPFLYLIKDILVSF